MASLGDFAKRIRKLAKGIETNADQAVRRCALAVDAAVVIATPVDTGRARSNWQVELNQPATSTRDPLDKSGAGAIAEGKRTIAQYKGGTPQASVHITNNLPYIAKLNDGHSAQAPAGFVERAIMVGVEAVKDFSIVRTKGPTNDN